MLQLTFGEILMCQHFIKSDGPPLFERLAQQNEQKLRKVMKNLIILLGPGVLANSIHEATEKLMLRSYPELLDFDGTQKLVIFIPERFLTKVPKYFRTAFVFQLSIHKRVIKVGDAFSIVLSKSTNSDCVVIQTWTLLNFMDPCYP